MPKVRSKNPQSLSPAQRSVRPSAAAETMTGGGHFRHPGRRWLPCVAGYFADLGVCDMPGARARPQNRHPGGVAGRLLPIAKLQAMMLARTRATLAPTRALLTQRSHHTMPIGPLTLLAPLAPLAL